MDQAKRMKELVAELQNASQGRRLVARSMWPLTVSNIDRKVEWILDCLEAAIDFIEKHPADPDIGAKQTKAWLRFLEVLKDPRWTLENSEE